MKKYDIMIMNVYELYWLKNGLIYLVGKLFDTGW